MDENSLRGWFHRKGFFWNGELKGWIRPQQSGYLTCYQLGDLGYSLQEIDPENNFGQIAFFETLTELDEAI